MWRRSVAVTVGVLHVCTACYSYAPVRSTPQPGAQVALEVTDEGRVALKEFAVPGQRPEIKVGDIVEVYLERMEDKLLEELLRGVIKLRRVAAGENLNQLRYLQEEAQQVGDIQNMLQATANDYWHYHYRFDEQGVERADEDREIGDPDDGQPDVDIPFGLGIFARAGDAEQVEIVQFHQSYGYEDFVQGWRPDGLPAQNPVLVNLLMPHQMCHLL